MSINATQQGEQVLSSCPDNRTARLTEASSFYYNNMPIRWPIYMPIETRRYFINSIHMHRKRPDGFLGASSMQKDVDTYWSDQNNLPNAQQAPVVNQVPVAIENTQISQEQQPIPIPTEIMEMLSYVDIVGQYQQVFTNFALNAAALQDRFQISLRNITNNPNQVTRDILNGLLEMRLNVDAEIHSIRILNRISQIPLMVSSQTDTPRAVSNTTNQAGQIPRGTEPRGSISAPRSENGFLAQNLPSTYELLYGNRSPKRVMGLFGSKDFDSYRVIVNKLSSEYYKKYGRHLQTDLQRYDELTESELREVAASLNEIESRLRASNYDFRRRNNGQSVSHQVEQIQASTPDPIVPRAESTDVGTEQNTFDSVFTVHGLVRLEILELTLNTQRYPALRNREQANQDLIAINQMYNGNVNVPGTILPLFRAPLIFGPDKELLVGQLAINSPNFTAFIVECNRLFYALPDARHRTMLQLIISSDRVLTEPVLGLDPNLAIRRLLGSIRAGQPNIDLLVALTRAVTYRNSDGSIPPSPPAPGSTAVNVLSDNQAMAIARGPLRTSQGYEREHLGHYVNEPANSLQPISISSADRRDYDLAVTNLTRIIASELEISNNSHTQEKARQFNRENDIDPTVVHSRLTPRQHASLKKFYLETVSTPMVTNSTSGAESSESKERNPLIVYGYDKVSRAVLHIMCTRTSDVNYMDAYYKVVESFFQSLLEMPALLREAALNKFLSDNNISLANFNEQLKTICRMDLSFSNIDNLNDISKIPLQTYLKIILASKDPEIYKTHGLLIEFIISNPGKVKSSILQYLESVLNQSTRIRIENNLSKELNSAIAKLIDAKLIKDQNFDIAALTLSHPLIAELLCKSLIYGLRQIDDREVLEQLNKVISREMQNKIPNSN